MAAARSLLHCKCAAAPRCQQSLFRAGELSQTFLRHSRAQIWSRQTGSRGRSAECRIEKKTEVLGTAAIPEGFVRLQLSEWDAAQLMLPAIGTQTFFKGSMHASVSHLRTRLRLIIQANPWLAGTLAYDSGSLVAVHPSTYLATNELADSFMHVAPDGLNINPSMSASQRALQMKRSNCFLPAGPGSVGKSPLVRLIVAPCMHADGTPATEAADFVVLFVLSHVVAGGPTYFQLYGMLSADSPVMSLNAERVHDAGQSVTEALGQDTTACLKNSMNHKLSTWFHRSFSPPAEVYSFLIDQEKIATLKAQFESQGSDCVQFVSTNDILCSSYARMVGARMLTIPMNLRGRVPGVAENLAGNYEYNLALDNHLCRTPASIRSFLTALRFSMGMEMGGKGKAERSVAHLLRPIPNVSTFLTDRYCALSNWSTIHIDLVIPECVEVFHRPMGDTDMLKKFMPYDLAIVFRVRPGQLGITLVSKRFRKEHFLKGMPLKEYEEVPGVVVPSQVLPANQRAKMPGAAV